MVARKDGRRSNRLGRSSLIAFWPVAYQDRREWASSSGELLREHSFPRVVRVGLPPRRPLGLHLLVEYGSRQHHDPEHFSVAARGTRPRSAVMEKGGGQLALVHGPPEWYYLARLHSGFSG